MGTLRLKYDRYKNITKQHFIRFLNPLQITGEGLKFDCFYLLHSFAIYDPIWKNVFCLKRLKFGTIKVERNSSTLRVNVGFNIIFMNGLQ